MKKNVVIITNYPIVYRDDLFNELSNSERINFNYIFIPDKPSTHKKAISNFENKLFLKDSKFIETNRLSSIFKLFKVLKNKKQDIIIIGGFPIYFFSLIIHKLLFRSKIIVWWGGTNHSESSVSKIKNLVRKFFSLYLDGAIYYSKLSIVNLRNINKNIHRSFILGNNTRNSKLFNKKIEEITVKNNKNEIILLTIGFQIERKNTIFILKNLNNIISDKKITLYVLGDGSELIKLKSFSKSHNLNVIFKGHVNQKDIYEYYKIADIFIHSSKLDQWPQTYTEAICSGLPVMISSTSGVSDDLTNKYNSEIIFDPNDGDEFVEKLQRLIDDVNLRKEIALDAKKLAFQNDGISKAKDLIDFLSTF